MIIMIMNEVLAGVMRICMLFVLNKRGADL